MVIKRIGVIVSSLNLLGAKSGAMVKPRKLGIATSVPIIPANKSVLTALAVTSVIVTLLATSVILATGKSVNVSIHHFIDFSLLFGSLVN